jgi:signal peptidase complex subunit 2
VVVEEEEVVYEELPQPHVIETGDSIKVKQVLDDATMAAITDAGYIANYSWENFKLFLMFLSCLFAVTAQFFPIPFPASRPLLAVCCASYFIISSILQFIVTFIDKDTIMFTRPKDVRTIFFN